MTKIEIEMFETAKGEMPENNSTILVWTYLLSAERARFVGGAFYMGDGRKWLTSPLSRVLFWCELYFAPINDDFSLNVDLQGNPNCELVAEMVAENQESIRNGTNK